MNAPSPFRPSALSPRTACVLNALLPSTQDGILAWPDKRVTLRLLPFPQPFAPCLRASVRWFGGLWSVEVGDIELARLHPLLRDLPPEALIPQALQAAAQDMLVLAALEVLGAAGGSPHCLEHETVDSDELAAPAEAPVPPVPDAFLWLEAQLPDGTHFPLRLRLPDDDTPVQAMLSALTQDLPPPSAAQILAEGRLPLSRLTVGVAVEAGSIRLNVEECRSLSVGDILLPDEYPASENRVRLGIVARSPLPVAQCRVSGLLATIDHLTLPPEASMNDSTTLEGTTPENPAVPTQSAPSTTEDSLLVADLDLAVSFELERRLMTLAEVANLRPGHTFTLTVDPLSPVTLRVQGKAVATGRLVDLGGTLGVQISSLS